MRIMPNEYHITYYIVLDIILSELQWIYCYYFYIIIINLLLNEFINILHFVENQWAVNYRLFYIIFYFYSILFNCA